MFSFADYSETLRNARLCSTGFSFACALLISANTLGADTQVFTDQQHPIEAPPGVRVIHLDAAGRIESELAADLPADPTKAATIVQQRLAGGGADLQRRLAGAYQGITDAWSLGVTKIPAVVVDGQYVVYGDPDVSRALTTIETFRRTQP